jgi:CheY-like chemotaxis protein
MEKNDKVSILYVEDQEDVRLFLSKILSRHYSRVYLAENGKIGLELYQQHNPDIIITDIKMPLMDGLSMSSRIKELNPKAQIILTTAHSDMEYFIHSIEIGINQYILKPIDREKLYRAIDICREQVMLQKEVELQNTKQKATNELLENLQHKLLLAENTNKIKQKLLTNLSHELRTPINGIFSISEILSRTSLSEEQTEYVDIIKKSGDNLLEITGNLMDINQLDEEETHPTFKLVNSNSIFEPVIEKYAQLATSKGIAFNIEQKEGFPETFVSDPRLISRVLEHFLNNAVKFTRIGEIKIGFDYSEADLYSWNIIIRVEDTGVGIKEDYLEKIFNIFSQQDDSYSRYYEGLGLGLTVCKKIATLLGAKIQVESQNGEGSIFTFNFQPRKQLVEFDNKPTRQSPPSLNLNVLCVEDKEVNQKILSIMLHNAGCKVDIAPNGLVALEMFEPGKYDVILMDIQMPVMDGLTATKELRKKYKSLPPVIGVSANALMINAKKYIDQGLDDYISKPVTPHILYEKIYRWVIDKEHQTEENSSWDETTLPGFSSDYNALPDVDMKTLDSLKEQTHNDHEIIRDLYSTYKLEADLLINKLREAIPINDRTTIKDSAHAVKGLSATIGAMKVYFIASEMDKLHKKGVFDETESLFELLQLEYDKAIKVIQEIILK